MATAQLLNGSDKALDPPPFLSLRYDENYRYLGNTPSSELTSWERAKYIPVFPESDGAALLSLGGEVRLQYFDIRNEAFGRIPGVQDVTLQHLVLHADFVWNRHLRFFSQLISAEEQGERPEAAPDDVEHLGFQQLFMEASLGGENIGRSYLRIGRQEILLGNQQLVKLREDSNVRLAFDAARMHIASGPFATDVFTGTVVQPNPGVFDTLWLDEDMVFSGINLGYKSPGDGLHIDAFAFDNRTRFVQYQNASGPEDRQTIGVHFDGHRGLWDFNYEVSEQFGTLGPLEIHAWGTALFTTRRWDDTVWKPRLTLGFSYVTGDRDRPGQLNTFNCLFARSDYFGSTSLLTGSNTIDLSNTLKIAPSMNLSSATQWDLLWRSQTTDGLYAPPLVFFVTGRGNEARFIGNQLTETVYWNLNRFVSIELICSVLVAGDFLKESTPGKTTQVVGLSTKCRF
jgi:hypothetical protein